MSFRCIFPGILSSGAGGGPWDISTASSLQSLTIATNAFSEFGLFFKPDGFKFFFISENVIYDFGLSTAWDISTGSQVRSFDVRTDGSPPTVGSTIVPSAVYFESDGLSMYVVDYNNVLVFKYSLSTAWDISTATFSQSCSARTNVALGLFFKPDGSKLYITSNSANRIQESNLTTPWDLSTETPVQAFTLASGTNASDLFFRDDGLKMYLIASAADNVLEYDLSTAWDVSTLSLVQSFSVTNEISEPASLFFKPDGTKMYVAGSNIVNEYNLG